MDYSFIELELTRQCIEECTPPGQDAEGAVTKWLARPEVSTQFAKLTLLDTARILYGYGAWEVAELGDLQDNLRRLLWLACGDIENDPDNTLHECSIAHAYLDGHGYTEELHALA
jgi:hypothetical protein